MEGTYTMRFSSPIAILSFAALIALGGCHRDHTPHATADDVEAAKQEAARDVAQARVEAKKDVKSAVKVAGPNSRDASEAKVVGSFDVAMAQAEGDHKIATEKCLTLQADAQQPCRDQADADYESAKTAAKATRVSRRQ
jgi:hypothetical protein